MRHWLRTTALAVLAAVCCLALAAPAAEALAERFWFQVVDELGNPITSGVTVHVYTTDSLTTATIYTSQTLGTAATNPASADSSGVFSFFADSASTPSFDVLVAHQRGFARIQALTPTTDHRVVINRQGRWKSVRFALDTSASLAPQTPGFSVPRGGMVLHAAVEVVANAGGAKNIDVGYTGTNGGYCSATAFGGTVPAFVVCTPTAAAGATARSIVYSHSGFTGTAYITVHYVELSNR